MRILWPIRKLGDPHAQHPGVMSLAAFLAANGHPSRVVPADPRRIAPILADGAPTILAFSTPSAYARDYVELSRSLKRDFPGTWSVFGGPHPTFFPEMVEEEGVDAVCRGEGEHALLDLVRRLDAGLPAGDVPNWWIREGGEVRRNDVRPLVADLDSLPVPDHGLFLRETPGQVEALVVTGRGCPYACTYCFNHAWRELYRGKGTPVRRRSVGHVMRELEAVKAAGVRFIRFMDDLFILRPDWVTEFAALYRQRIGIPFSCLVRANHVTPGIVAELAAAGCVRMMMGVEAGDDRVRNEVLGRKMDRETILEAARVIRGAGLRLVTANILAIPGGSFEADWETLRLNVACRPNYASAALLQPFPRTRIHGLAGDMGLLGDPEASAAVPAFGLRSPLRFQDPREQRRMENLHKLFGLGVRFPVLLPVIRRLVEFPPNPAFDLAFRLASSWGRFAEAVPLRVGLAVFVKRWRHRLGGGR